MFNNPYNMPNYLNTFNQQATYDNIDSQINKLQQLKEQMKNNQQPAINQTFQLAPNSVGGMKYVNSIDDVNKEHVFVDTPFFSKDMSVLWIKNTSGDIKSYELKEIIQKDDKDMQIEMLQAQINEMKGMIENARTNDEYVDEPVESEKSTNVSNVRTSPKKQKQS